MLYTTLGARTGLRVSELALGTANFGTRWGTGADFESAKQMFDTFVASGGTFIDTADVYQFGESETFLAQLIKPDRDQLVLATKFTQGDNPEADISRTGNSRKAMTRALEASLRRLATDYIDLYWVHWPDFVTPVEEILETVDLLVRAGKILHAGFSNFPAWRSALAAGITAERGLSAQFIAVQSEFSLVERSADRDIIPMAEALQLGIALYSPLGGGLLTGKYRTSDQGRLTTLGTVIHREDTPQKSLIVDAVLAVAEQTGAKPSQVAMAWELERGRRLQTAVIPIIGPRTPQQLDDYLGALDVRLDDLQYEGLSHVSAPKLGAPHDDAAERMDANLGRVGTRFVHNRPVP
jgi:aryl-alcohol dehydrogenase-like predicted oxidoreductase